MPITKITIENFKGIRDRVEIPIRPITLLFGANSAGKSTMLQAMLYFRALLRGASPNVDSLFDADSNVDIGGFPQFVHNHDLSRKVTVGVEYTLDEDGLDDGDVSVGLAEEDSEVTLHLSGLVGVSTVSVEIEVSWSHEMMSAWATALCVCINGRLLARVESDPGFEPTLSLLDPEHPILSEQVGLPTAEVIGFISDLLHRRRRDGKEGLNVPLDLKSVIPDHSPLNVPSDIATMKEYRNIAPFAGALVGWCLHMPTKAILNELNRHRHVGAVRIIPDRNFQARRSTTEGRWASGAAAWDLLYRQDAEKWWDADAFRELGLGYKLKFRRFYEIGADSAIASFLMNSSFHDELSLTELESNPLRREAGELKEKTTVALVEERTGIEVDPCDVGVGVSQVIPVVVGAMAPGNRVLTVEQPELHLHPAIQCSLADIFIKEVHENEDRVFLLETHSEHFLLRLMKRVRQTTTGDLPKESQSLAADQISILYVESCEDRSVFREMPINSQGELIKAWPGGFFEEDLDELL